ncbi:MAG: glycosyltransferase family 39 protein, partial [Elusimicrobia bacterium]|nr:glycosyltransferase family 39 protein [Elusimicrobiota bacterium]
MRRAWLVLFAAAGVLYVLARRAYWVGFFNDDAFYLIGARSLLAGRFAELNHPLAPPLIQYLPGYPLLLAPVLALFRGSWLACRLESALFMLGSAGAAAWALGEELDEPGRLLLAALCLLNPLALSLSGAILSDAPFTLAALLVVGTAKRRWGRRDAGTWLLLGAAAGASFYLRAVGLALPLALGLVLLPERRWKEAALALGAAAAVVAPWLVRNHLARGQALLYAGELGGPFEASPWREAAGALR